MRERRKRRKGGKGVERERGREGGRGREKEREGETGRGREREREKWMNKNPVMEKIRDEGIPGLSSEMFSHKKEKNKRALRIVSDIGKTFIFPQWMRGPVPICK